MTRGYRFCSRSCLIFLILVIIYGIMQIEENITSDIFKRGCKDVQRRNYPSNKQEHLGYLIPHDEIIDGMTGDERDKLYWKYINSIQMLCRNQMRFGNLGDGGKNLCLDKPYKPTGKCIVYSFGSFFKFDFEEAVERHFKCEIHTFDPSKPLGKHTVPDGIQFHFTGLGPENTLNSEGWSLKTLSTLQVNLNHTKRVIDVLKIDIEKYEWGVLPELLQTGSLQNVKQLCIEIHYSSKESKLQLKILRRLYEAGFHIFMHEPNENGKRRLSYPYQSMSTMSELSLVNINWTYKERKLL